MGTGKKVWSLIAVLVIVCSLPGCAGGGEDLDGLDSLWRHRREYQSSVWRNGLAGWYVVHSFNLSPAGRDNFPGRYGAV